MFSLQQVKFQTWIVKETSAVGWESFSRIWVNSK